VTATPWPGVFATDVESARHYERHWHSSFGIGFIERGAHRSLSGRGIVDAQAGDVITCNPGEVHDGRPLGALSRRWRIVYLDPPVLASMSLGGDGPEAEIELSRPVIQDPFLAAALRRLLSRLQRRHAGADDSPDHALACEESLVLVCERALRRHSTAPPRREACGDVRRARERLADDLGSPPSLGELAALVGMSRYQLLRRFERVYGLTPHEWLRQLRVERARDAIRRGGRLADVAASCGFADQSHMTRAFVARFGFTPGAWARAASGTAPA
jgi:AraC-like DNA-binding protein